MLHIFLHILFAYRMKLHLHIVHTKSHIMHIILHIILHVLHIYFIYILCILCIFRSDISARMAIQCRKIVDYRSLASRAKHRMGRWARKGLQKNRPIFSKRRTLFSKRRPHVSKIRPRFSKRRLWGRLGWDDNGRPRCDGLKVPTARMMRRGRPPAPGPVPRHGGGG